jgi:hypothetical protein
MGPLQAMEQLQYLYSHRGVEHRHRLVGHQEKNRGRIFTFDSRDSWATIFQCKRAAIVKEKNLRLVTWCLTFYSNLSG